MKINPKLPQNTANNASATNSNNSPENATNQTQSSSLSGANTITAPSSGRASSVAANDNRAPASQDRIEHTNHSAAPPARSQSSAENAEATEFFNLMGQLAESIENPTNADNTEQLTQITDGLHALSDKHLNASIAQHQSIAKSASSAAATENNSDIRTLLNTLSGQLNDKAEHLSQIRESSRKIWANQHTALQLPKASTAEGEEARNNQADKIFLNSIEIQAQNYETQRAQAPKDKATLNTINTLVEKAGSTTVANIDLSDLQKQLTIEVQQHDFMEMMEGLTKQLLSGNDQVNS